MRTTKAKRMPATKQPKNQILSVTIRKMFDESPDTSWLGEYVSRVKSEYTIDRRHDKDCAAQKGVDHGAASAMLDRVISRAEDSRIVCDAHTSNFDDNCVECKLERDSQSAVDLLTDIQNNLDECDCGGQHIDRNIFEYFEPNWRNYQGEPDSDIRKYCWQDYARMESLNNGNFCFIGIRADAEIGIPQGLPHPVTGQSYLIQRLTSGGLWGIESDSDASYIESEEKSQLAELRETLRSMGFGTRAISTAFKSIERKEE